MAKTQFIINSDKQWYINLKSMRMNGKLWSDMIPLMRKYELITKDDDIKIVERDYNYKNDDWLDVTEIMDEIYDKYEDNADEELVFEYGELKLHRIYPE